MVVREALATLDPILTMAKLVHRNYEKDFNGKKGNTVTIRKPATFVADDYTRGAGMQIQDATEDFVDVTLDQIIDVSFKVTAEQMTLDIKDFSEQLLQPAMEAIALSIDQKLFGRYVDIPYSVGVAGTTPSTINPIIDARKSMGGRSVSPRNRHMVLDTDAEANMLLLPIFTAADQVGDDGTALREASLGRKFGWNMLSSVNITDHANGTLATSGSVLTDGAIAVGVTTLIIDASTSMTGTVSAGSLIQIANSTTGLTEEYVVTALATAGSNQVSVEISPAAPVGGIADGEVVTFIASHTPNMAFNRDAFALVTRSLALPMSVEKSKSAILDYKGIGLRVVYSYDADQKSDIISIDTLAGVKTLDEKRAVRVLG